ncbi:hypothetical protein [Pseudomonas sp. PS01298]|uniref:hypothetical protein n=1 Tax=Pseudomonas sp. PS01298 TaxID=2991434 RepID=UPI00249A76CA|nr:hypothetical protein [Pseudomonas sp. PS01298]
MPSNSDSNIATADALLLHNQHALGAAIEEVTRWLSENGKQLNLIASAASLKSLQRHLPGSLAKQHIIDAGIEHEALCAVTRQN